MAPKSRTKRTTKSARRPTTRASPKTPVATTSAAETTAEEITPPETTAVEITSSETTAEEITPPETTAVEVTPPETTAVEITPPETPAVEITPPETTAETIPLEASAGTATVTTVATIPLGTTALETADGAAAPGKSSEQETADKSAEQEPAGKTTAKPAVKKTIRVVKKVIKKKVIKRVPKPSNEVAKPELLLVDGDGNNTSVSAPIEVENSKQPEAPECEDSKPDSAVAQCDVVNETQSRLDSPNVDLVVTQTDRCEVGNLDDDSGVGGDVQESVLKEKVENCEDDGYEKKEVDNSENGGQKDEKVENCEDGGRKEEKVENCEDSGRKEEKEKGNGATRDEEMEVSERRRRRKTEIFVGGLDKDAKEDDLRKVFEKIGEIVEVRLMKNNQTGKNKGYAFLRYASAADAKTALTEYSKVEVCGKLCGTAPVEVNDTIFLGNIDKKWKKEDIVKLLHDIGIEKIDTVTVMSDPNNAEYNRGFAFLELETNKDAQSAYKKLQKKDVFGKGRNIKVAWAEPLNEPDEEEMLKVKSVYAEGVPSSWDEEKVKKHFDKYGEIDRVVLARNMHSARRKDFAFVNYTTREAALACIESINKEGLTDEGTKVNVRASLAKPISKGKQNKGGSKPSTKDHSKEKPKAAQRDTNLNSSSNKGKSEVSYGYTRDRKSSTTHQLTQVLREQASWRPGQISLGRGYRDQDYLQPMPGGKRPLSALGDNIPFSDPRAYPRARLDSSFPVASASYSTVSQGISGASLPYYQQQSIAGHRSDSSYGSADHSGYLQARLGPAPYGSGLYRRY
ncbi:nucleolin 2-like isoform X2 [Macadamia integrifolia]|uniref:nucleolin 2-like isoform X2 n=1 Tax=Macadamia integrifolia TaxID=60698 RepID=UPI001C4F879B|nr:nucleolin 2-like isoform X2 [Macadamia integrifolia]